jgi:hypothetical protein
METIGLILTALALVAFGCVATTAVAYIPLWLQVRAQPHGRYAGLSASAPEAAAPTDKARGPRLPIAERPAPNLIVA